MHLYRATYPELTMTLMVRGELIRIAFEQFYFSTDDKDVVAAIEAHPQYGVQFYKVKEKAKPERKPVAYDAIEELVIKKFMEAPADAGGPSRAVGLEEL